ncbi:MAG: site-specific DNA-methyltransferase, partial [Turicibacter sanguinis]
MKHQELTMNLINGECLQAMQGIPDKSVDMILCDLPYGTTANQWDHIIPVVPLWNEYERIIKDNGAIVLFTQPPFNFKLAYPRLNLFRYEWIWVKENATGFLNARRMPLKLTENILV